MRCRRSSWRVRPATAMPESTFSRERGTTASTRPFRSASTSSEYSMPGSSSWTSSEPSRGRSAKASGCSSEAPGCASKASGWASEAPGCASKASGWASEASEWAIVRTPREPEPTRGLTMTGSFWRLGSKRSSRSVVAGMGTDPAQRSCSVHLSRHTRRVSTWASTSRVPARSNSPRRRASGSSSQSTVGTTASIRSRRQSSSRKPGKSSRPPGGTSRRRRGPSRR